MNRWMLAAMLLIVACGKDKPIDLCGTSGDRCAQDLGNTAPDVGGTGDTDIPQPDATVPDGSTPADTDVPDTSEPDMGEECKRTLRAANSARKVVTGMPFATPPIYEVFDLDAAGELTRPNVTFTMGRAYDGEILFTPDGQFGYSIQDDGTIGVFRFNNAGLPEVLVAVHNPGFYASGAVIDELGENLYVWETGFRKLDDGTANGALYRLPITCATGLPAAAVEVLRTKLMWEAHWVSPGRLAVAATDLLDDVTPHDAHMVDLAGPTRVASISAFPDDDAIVGGFTVSRDGLYMLIGDTSAFSGIPNRVGVIGIQGDGLFAQQVLEIEDPTRIFVSPFNNAAIVLSTFGDAIVVLTYNPMAAVSAFTVVGPLNTVAPVQLPLGSAMIQRGDLDGMVIIAENTAIRRVRFMPNGEVVDGGVLSLGPGVASIPGALGVQP